MTQPGLSAAELARLDSYVLDIAGARGAPVADSSGNWRFGSKGSLLVAANGQFHSFEDGTHGFSAFQLIEHLHPAEDAVAWGRAWLATHPGVGAFTPGESDPVDDFAEVEATTYIQSLYGGAAALNDRPGAIYLTQTRGLPLAPEDALQLRWVADFRGAEGGLIAPITNDDGKLVRLLVTHVTADGLKSPHAPARITLRGATCNRFRATRVSARCSSQSRATLSLLPPTARWSCAPPRTFRVITP